MIYSVQQIKYEILAHIKEFGGEFGDWYIGVSGDPRAALTRRHHVDETQDIWLYKRAVSFQACRTVQRYFLERLQADGEPASDPSGEEHCVYAFKKSERTMPGAGSGSARPGVRAR